MFARGRSFNVYCQPLWLNCYRIRRVKLGGSGSYRAVWLGRREQGAGGTPVRERSDRRHTGLATSKDVVRPRNPIASDVHLPPLIDGLCLFAERFNNRRSFAASGAEGAKLIDLLEQLFTVGSVCLQRPSMYKPHIGLPRP